MGRRSFRTATTGSCGCGMPRPCAGSDGTVMVCDLAGDRGGESPAVYRGHVAEPRYAVFSPDATIIASSDGAGVVKLWDAAGSWKSPLRGHTRTINAVRFSGDGKR